MTAADRTPQEIGVRTLDNAVRAVKLCEALTGRRGRLGHKETMWHSRPRL